MKPIKTILWGAAALFGIQSAILADQFRLKETKGGDTADVSYATVKIKGSGSTVFEGRTDKYGRITIDLPKGNYQAEVTVGAKRTGAELKIDGDKALKKISVK